ncbi:MAG: WG repeat-containing protein [Bacteroidales bacterium]|nr:WG repeat-containing protein [Bacteroidales bacterium]
MNTFDIGTPWLFFDGLAAVKVKNRWGFIDKNGNIAIEPKYNDAFGFSEGLAAVEIDKKYGFIDRNGNMVIDPMFNFVIAFSEGLASVVNGNNCSIIDKTGNTIATLGDEISDLQQFSEGLAAAEVQHETYDDVNFKYGFVDRSGRMVIKPQFEWVGAFSDGLAVAVLTPDGPVGYIDKTGLFVINAQYDEAEDFSEGLAPVKKDGKWCFIDRTGAVVTMLGDRYDNVFSISEGRAIVKKDDKYGAIDKAGNLIVDVQFDSLFNFSEGLAFARAGKTQGFINASGVFEIQKPVPKPSLFDIISGKKNQLRW